MWGGGGGGRIAQQQQQQQQRRQTATNAGRAEAPGEESANGSACSFGVSLELWRRLNLVGPSCCTCMLA